MKFEFDSESERPDVPEHNGQHMQRQQVNMWKLFTLISEKPQLRKNATSCAIHRTIVKNHVN